MTIKTYPDYLRARKIPVVELGGVHWMQYNRALIPASAMPVHIELDRPAALEAVKKTGSLFLRYTTRPGDTETGWWNMICREYSMSRVSANTRSKIRRGLKRMSIHRAEPLWLAEHGYECHVQSYARYQNASPMSREAFYAFLSSLDGLPFFDAWACRDNDELRGYILCLREKEGVFLHTIDITPAGLKDYAAYAMIHHLLDHYINEAGLPVCNGSRSISHATEMQDFLAKFGFEREHCTLHILYRPGVKIAIRILYPLRNMIKYLQFLPVIQKISAVLHQEEIARNQPGVSS